MIRKMQFMALFHFCVRLANRIWDHIGLSKEQAKKFR